jgi:polyisoprenoid-binding protein YceI
MRFASALAPLCAAALLLAAHGGASAQTADKGNYRIDPEHSTVHFTIGHLGLARFTGRFNQIKGDIVVDGAGDGNKVKAEIDVASIDTNSEKRDKHLRSPDYFNAVQFPKMTFESTKVSLPPGAEGTMTGNLTMHGVTKPVTFKVRQIGAGKDPWGGYRAGYVATTTLKRSDFGMKLSAGVGDEVEVSLGIEAIKQ